MDEFDIRKNATILDKPIIVETKGFPIGVMFSFIAVTCLIIYIYLKWKPSKNKTFGKIEENVKDSLDTKFTGRRNAGNTGFVINCERPSSNSMDMNTAVTLYSEGVSVWDNSIISYSNTEEELDRGLSSPYRIEEDDDMVVMSSDYATPAAKSINYAKGYEVHDN